MENKQTAVQWLQDKLFELEIKIDYTAHQETFFLFEQAKQMEREQIIDAHGDKSCGGFRSNGDLFMENKTGDEYYKETYGN